MLHLIHDQEKQHITGCPTESVKKSAGTAEGKTESFEIKVQAYLTHMSTILKPHVFVFFLFIYF